SREKAKEPRPPLSATFAVMTPFSPGGRRWIGRRPRRMRGRPRARDRVSFSAGELRSCFEMHLDGEKAKEPGGWRPKRIRHAPRLQILLGELTERVGDRAGAFEDDIGVADGFPAEAGADLVHRLV